MSSNRLEPIPDRPAGENVPYRGAVDHGVPFVEEETPNEAHYHMGRPVEWLPEDADDKVKPIPVVIVREAIREVKSIQTAQIPIAIDERREVIGRDPKRATVKIRNIGANGVAIGNLNVSRFSGYLLVANAEISLVTTEPVYAVDVDSLGSTLSILVETVEAVR